MASIQNVCDWHFSSLFPDGAVARGKIASAQHPRLVHTPTSSSVVPPSRRSRPTSAGGFRREASPQLGLGLVPLTGGPTGEGAKVKTKKKKKKRKSKSQSKASSISASATHSGNDSREATGQYPHHTPVQNGVKLLRARRKQTPNTASSVEKSLPPKDPWRSSSGAEMFHLSSDSSEDGQSDNGEEVPSGSAGVPTESGEELLSALPAHQLQWLQEMERTEKEQNQSKGKSRVWEAPRKPSAPPGSKTSTSPRRQQVHSTHSSPRTPRLISDLCVDNFAFGFEDAETMSRYSRHEGLVAEEMSSFNFAELVSSLQPPEDVGMTSKSMQLTSRSENSHMTSTTMNTSHPVSEVERSSTTGNIIQVEEQPATPRSVQTNARPSSATSKGIPRANDSAKETVSNQQDKIEVFSKRKSTTPTSKVTPAQEENRTPTKRSTTATSTTSRRLSVSSSHRKSDRPPTTARQASSERARLERTFPVSARSSASGSVDSRAKGRTSARESNPTARDLNGTASREPSRSARAFNGTAKELNGNTTVRESNTSTGEVSRNSSAKGSHSSTTSLHNGSPRQQRFQSRSGSVNRRPSIDATSGSPATSAIKQNSVRSSSSITPAGAVPKDRITPGTRDKINASSSLVTLTRSNLPAAPATAGPTSGRSKVPSTAQSPRKPTTAPRAPPSSAPANARGSRSWTTQPSSGGMGKPSTFAGTSPRTPRQSSVREDPYEKAADALMQSDFLLIGAGAGFSADSGLKVYKDIADVPAYHRLGLTYGDLCEPRWIRQDPKIFFGFWGSCYNSYKDTDPHEGYEILVDWVDYYFTAENRSKIAEYNAKKSGRATAMMRLTEKLDINPFIFTSNVDCMFKRVGFPPSRVYEFHGTTMQWQCSLPCRNGVWDLKHDYRFEVDPKTMKAPQNKSRAPDESETQPERSPFYEPGEPPKSSSLLKFMSHDADANNNIDNQLHKMLFRQDHLLNPNFITCPHCHRNARPNVLMFDDGAWIEVDDAHYKSWIKKMKRSIKEDSSKRLTILEIGCGLRIPTVRKHSQKLLKEIGNAKLIRVNPEHPNNPKQPHQTIPVKNKCLATIKKIDEILRKRFEEIGIELPPPAGARSQREHKTLAVSDAVEVSSEGESDSSESDSDDSSSTSS